MICRKNSSTSCDGGIFRRLKVLEKLSSNPKHKTTAAAALIDKLNILYGQITEGKSKYEPDALKLLEELRLNGYSFSERSTWEFFKKDVLSPDSKYFELYKQFLIAGKLTSSHLLQDQHHEALHWQQKRNQIQEDLNRNILSEIKNPHFFQLLKNKVIEYRLSGTPIDEKAKHIMRNTRKNRS